MRDTITDDVKVVAVKIQGVWEVLTRHGVDRDRFYRPEGFMGDVTQMKGYPTRILERYSDEYGSRLVLSNVVEYSTKYHSYRWEYDANREVWSCTTHVFPTLCTRDMLGVLDTSPLITSIRFLKEVKDV